jgi:hypothetical protein
MTLDLKSPPFDVEAYFDVKEPGIALSPEEQLLMQRARALWMHRNDDSNVGMPREMSEYQDIAHLLTLVIYKCRAAGAR